MRNRYYSPDNSSPLKPKQREQKKSIHKVDNPLRTATSATKLPVCHTFTAEKKVGTYVYDVSKEMGRGFSSIVFQGINVQTKLKCAVKVVDTKNYNQSSMRMLQNQIKILRALQHPNIIKLLDVYRTLTHCYIITELCAHGDLASYITKQGRVSQVSAVEIMSQIIEGVKHLFSKGILHRDLKPANILKGDKCWKIADFGFAIFADSKIKSRYNVGTPLYMSPETLIDNVYSPLTDIFSIGIIFYQLLTGTTPWQTKSQKNLVKKIKDEPYHFPQNIQVSGSISSTLRQMCSKLLEERLTRQNFMTLNLKYESLNPSNKFKLSNMLGIKNDKQLEESKNKSLIKQLEKSSQVSSQIQTKNNKILICQLQYCRFMSYFIKNMKYLQINSKNKIKFTLLLFRHVDKVIKLLGSNKVNTFNLENWKEFKESKKYEGTLATLKQYEERYCKEYQQYLKEADAAVVQQVNRNFSSFTTNDTFSTDSYAQILTFIENIVRQCNHNLTVITKGLRQPLQPEVKANIQALKSLYKYHQLIRLALTHYNNYLAFERQSAIRIQGDYSESSTTLEDYNKLRDELKSI